MFYITSLESLTAIKMARMLIKILRGDLRLSIKKYRISQILYYSGNPAYRYLLDGYPTNRKQSASFTEEELKR